MAYIEIGKGEEKNTISKTLEKMAVALVTGSAKEGNQAGENPVVDIEDLGKDNSLKTSTAVPGVGGQGKSGPSIG